MQNELKPCPFCGGKVSIGALSGGFSGDCMEFWQIYGGSGEGECKCNLTMESNIFWSDEYGGEKEKEEPIKRWNRRI